MLNKIIQTIKVIVILAFFGLGIYFAFLDKNYQFLVFLGTGFAFIFIFFTKYFAEFISSIKIKDAEIQLRKLKDGIEELKMVTKFSIKGMLNTIKFVGLWHSPELEIERYRLHKESLEVLKALNIPEKEIQNLTQKYHEGIESDYVHAINNQIEKIMRDNNCSEEEVTEFRENKCTSPDTIKSIINNEKYKDNQELNTLVSDYEYYRINKDHKDFNRWLQLSE